MFPVIPIATQSAAFYAWNLPRTAWHCICKLLNSGNGLPSGSFFPCELIFTCDSLSEVIAQRIQ